jgi:hypothetical protein
MPVQVCGEKGQAEVPGDRFLEDGGAFAPPIGAERFDLFGGSNRHRQFSRIPCVARRGRDVAARPQAEPKAGRKFEHDEIRRGIERLPIEQASVKSGARLRVIDIEQDEMR